MATGVIRKTIKELGAIQNVSFPFTAPSDGVLYYNFSVNSSSSAAFVYLKRTNDGVRNMAQHVHSSGVSICSSFVVKKGWQIAVDHISNATFNNAQFVPFE